MTDRCPWCGTDPVYVAYHDTEWGVPERGGRALWELLILEGFQAGLSWITILRKRAAFCTAFAGFQPDVIAGWGGPDVARLMRDAGIVRHRGKIEGAIASARAYVAMGGADAFAEFIWTYVDGAPLQPLPMTPADIPVKSALSDRLSKDLRRAGFAFCGPTIAYAFMQAAGLINDHLTTCPRHASVAAMARR